MDNERRAVLLAGLAAVALFGAAGCGSDSSTSDAASAPDAQSSNDAASDAGTADSGNGGTDASHADGGQGDTGSVDSGVPDSGAADASQGGPDAGSSDAGSSDAGCLTLTVKNTLVWCSISVGTGTASSASEQTVCVPAGTVDLAATPKNSSFILGPWHHTSGDQGYGDPGNVTGTGSTARSTTTVVVSGATCVWICCPFTGGSGCPTTEQCP
jgi:hypothetical protein